MVKCGWSVVFLATLILLPPAAWGRELLDSPEEGDASGLNSNSDSRTLSALPAGPNSVDPLITLAGTNLCLSWEPDAKSTIPSLVQCTDTPTVEWSIGDSPSIIRGAKCLTVCIDGGSGCRPLSPPQQDVILTPCESGPTPASQLWERRKGRVGPFVELVSLQNNNCLTAGEGIVTAPCTGARNQLWSVNTIPP